MLGNENQRSLARLHCALEIAGMKKQQEQRSLTALVNQYRGIQSTLGELSHYREDYERTLVQDSQSGIRSGELNRRKVFINNIHCAIDEQTSKAVVVTQQIHVLEMRVQQAAARENAIAKLVEKHEAERLKAEDKAEQRINDECGLRQALRMRCHFSDTRVD